MRNYENFTEKDVVDIRGLSIEQVQQILDLNPKNDCDVERVINYDFYRPLGDIGKGRYGYFKDILKPNYTCHPASDFLEPELKRGDRVMVWDDYESRATERIFLAEIKGYEYPYICVSDVSEEKFLSGQTFLVNVWKNCKPIPQKEQLTIKQLAELAGKNIDEIEIID